MSALLNGLRGLSRHGFLTISDEIRADLQWWLNFLPKYNGISIIPLRKYGPDIPITDACQTGAGGHFQNQCFHVAFLDNAADNADNINVKELLAIIVALKLSGPQLSGTRIVICSDNLTAIQAISNRRSHSVLIQYLNISQFTSILSLTCSATGTRTLRLQQSFSVCRMLITLYSVIVTIMSLTYRFDMSAPQL